MPCLIGGGQVRRSGQVTQLRSESLHGVTGFVRKVRASLMPHYGLYNVAFTAVSPSRIDPGPSMSGSMALPEVAPEAAIIIWRWPTQAALSAPSGSLALTGRLRLRRQVPAAPARSPADSPSRWQQWRAHWLPGRAFRMRRLPMARPPAAVARRPHWSESPRRGQFGPLLPAGLPLSAGAGRAASDSESRRRRPRPAPWAMRHRPRGPAAPGRAWSRRISTRRGRY